MVPLEYYIRKVELTGQGGSLRLRNVHRQICRKSSEIGPWLVLNVNIVTHMLPTICRTFTVVHLIQLISLNLFSHHPSVHHFLIKFIYATNPFSHRLFAPYIRGRLYRLQIVLNECSSFYLVVFSFFLKAFSRAVWQIMSAISAGVNFRPTLCIQQAHHIVSYACIHPAPLSGACLQYFTYYLHVAMIERTGKSIKYISSARKNETIHCLKMCQVWLAIQQSISIYFGGRYVQILKSQLQILLDTLRFLNVCITLQVPGESLVSSISCR